MIHHPSSSNSLRAYLRALAESKGYVLHQEWKQDKGYVLWPESELVPSIIDDHLPKVEVLSHEASRPIPFVSFLEARRSEVIGASFNERYATLAPEYLDAEGRVTSSGLVKTATRRDALRQYMKDMAKRLQHGVFEEVRRLLAVWSVEATTERPGLMLHHLSMIWGAVITGAPMNQLIGEKGLLDVMARHGDERLSAAQADRLAELLTIREELLKQASPLMIDLLILEIWVDAALRSIIPPHTERMREQLAMSYDRDRRARWTEYRDWIAETFRRCKAEGSVKSNNECAGYVQEQFMELHGDIYDEPPSSSTILRYANRR